MFATIPILTTRSCVVPCSKEFAQKEPLSQIWASLIGPDRASVAENERCTTPKVPSHLFPPVVLHVSPPTVPMVSSQSSVTATGPSPAPTVKKFAPVDSHSPVAALYVSGWVVPPTVASSLAPTTVGSPPKSTAARTPIVQAEPLVKYGSVHVPGKSVTLRTSGGLGCAPLPEFDHPRAWTMPLADPRS